MPKKKIRHNPLKIKIRPVTLPKNVTPKRFFQGLLNVMDGYELPRRWEVDLSWRNPATRSGRTRYWQTDQFEDAVADSSSGFNSMLRRMIVRKLRSLR